jgi:rhodanese-related sulfurtransferase
VERTTVDELLARARERIAPRLSPDEVARAMTQGALLIDLRSHDERAHAGVVPGSLHLPRSVLEWRLDPDSGWTNPHVGGLDRQLVLMCAQGYSSSFAAATARELGYAQATDLVGGFDAWVAAGLPVHAPTSDASKPKFPLGLGAPEPADPPVERRTRWLSV